VINNTTRCEFVWGGTPDQVTRIAQYTSASQGNIGGCIANMGNQSACGSLVMQLQRVKSGAQSASPANSIEPEDVIPCSVVTLPAEDDYLLQVEVEDFGVGANVGFVVCVNKGSSSIWGNLWCGDAWWNACRYWSAERDIPDAIANKHQASITSAGWVAIFMTPAVPDLACINSGAAPSGTVSTLKISTGSWS
jgi:hypothetical protein